MTLKKDFFISYNEHDKQWAEWIAWHLEEAGYQVMIQLWDWGHPGGRTCLIALTTLTIKLKQ